MNIEKCLDMARKQASNAKDGTLLVNGEKYTFTFDANTWVYVVKDSQGIEQTRFNTKSLKQARVWLKEWFNN
jgi:hypothetical protein